MAQLIARLGAKDLDREVKFFNGLGFEGERKADRARLERDGVVVLLEVWDTMRVSDRPLLDWERSPANFGAGVQLYLMVDSVDDVAASIPVGIPRPWPVQDKASGLRELTVRTPTGYLLTFAQRARR